MEVKTKKPDIRYLDEMRIVLYDKKFAKRAKNFKVYYMYRGIKKKGGLRYDITVMPPRMLGEEFVKTKGHEHRGTYGELYTVLSGTGIFLIQKSKDGKIEDVYYTKAKKEEYILIPPKYGHITINPSSKRLKVGNWVSMKCKNDFKKLEEKEGACYFYLKSGWKKNKNYKRVPKLKFKKPLKSKPTNLESLYGT